MWEINLRGHIVQGFPFQAKELQINSEQWKDSEGFKAECSQACFTKTNPVDLCIKVWEGERDGGVIRKLMVRCEGVRV